jgi:hypothetical protein
MAFAGLPGWEQRSFVTFASPRGGADVVLTRVPMRARDTLPSLADDWLARLRAENMRVLGPKPGTIGGRSAMRIVAVMPTAAGVVQQRVAMIAPSSTGPRSLIVLSLTAPFGDHRSAEAFDELLASVRFLDMSAPPFAPPPASPAPDFTVPDFPMPGRGR